jgi:hypothetical protein
MDFSKRERLVNRITSGTLYAILEYQYDSFPVVFKDPNLSIRTQADYKYKVSYENALKEGAINLEESYNILRKDGTWSDKLENELITLRKDVKNIKSKLSSLRFHKLQQKQAQDAIQRGYERIDKLENLKNQLWTSTAEALAEAAKRRFVISQITEIDNKSLLINPSFCDALAVLYYRNHAIPQNELRELSRTDPWRLYWTVSKETGTSLFPHSIVETTELQYALLSWSRIYDFAYESSNRPTDDIIADDDKFDSWYDAECDRIKQELSKNNFNNSFGVNINGIGGQEVFIPADAEGAKEVYALNDPQSRARIAEREKAIQEKGSISEANLPDVKRDLIMAANKAAVPRS